MKQPLGKVAVVSPLGSPRLPHHHEPSLRPTLAEVEVLQIGPDLVPGRLAGLDHPALGEGVLDLLPSHPPRPLIARLGVRKAEQEQPVDPQEVNAVGFMLSDKNAGPFELEVESIKVVRGAGK